MFWENNKEEKTRKKKKKKENCYGAALLWPFFMRYGLSTPRYVASHRLEQVAVAAVAAAVVTTPCLFFCPLK